MKKLYDDTNIQSCANQLRAGLEITDTMKVSQFPSKIQQLASDPSDCWSILIKNSSQNILNLVSQIPDGSAVRIHYANWYTDTGLTLKALFDKLDKLTGLSKRGKATSKAQVSGTIHIGVCGPSELTTQQARYPNLECVANTLGWSVTFHDYNGNVLHTESVSDGGTAAYSTNPTRAATAQYSYAFAGWAKTPNGAVDTNAKKNIKNHTDLYAVYTQTVRQYTVRFYDGSTLLKSISVPYGQNAVYNGDEPARENTAQYSYAFAGWAASDGGAANTNILNGITANKDVYAAFTTTVKTYTIYFRNIDGTLLQTKEVAYGATPAYSGGTPIHPSAYSFKAWTPALSAVTGSKTYYATYQYPTAWTESITDSWEQIVEACQAGTYKTKYSLGATKIADFGSEGLTLMHLVGFDDSELADGGYCKMSWVPEHCLKTMVQWNTSNSNNGGYSASNLKKHVDGLISKLPKTLQDNIALVKKTCRLYGSTDQTVNLKLWPPSCRELFGSGSSWSETSGPIFTNPPKAPKMTGATPSGNAQISWLRSADYYVSSDALCLLGIGSYDGYDCSISCGVLPGFCL